MRTSLLGERDVIVLIARRKGPKVAHSPSWTNCGKEVSVSCRRGAILGSVIRDDPCVI